MITHDFGSGPVPAHQHSNGGGWVADTASVDATAYVGPNASVFEDASVFGNAWVSGNAQVFGDAAVSEDAQVFGNATVSGDARVSEGEREMTARALESGYYWVTEPAHSEQPPFIAEWSSRYQEWRTMGWDVPSGPDELIPVTGEKLMPPETR